MIIGAHLLLYSEGAEADRGFLRDVLLRMRIACCLVLCLSTLGSRSLGAQRPLVVVHFPLKLIDLSVLADTTYGLQILAQPGLRTAEGKQNAQVIRLRFDPDSAFAWLNTAASALRVPAPGGPANAVQWSPALNAVGGRGAIALGRTRKKGALDKPYWFAITDSTPGWRVEIAGQEADSLLRLLLVLASRSRIDSTRDSLHDDHFDRPAKVIHQPTPSWPGEQGRVLVQFVVGVDGRAEAESFLVLVASSPALEKRAWEAVRSFRFAPAQKGGNPARQLVQQVIEWRTGKP